MPAELNAYLNFSDQARAAMEFYQSVFGGELQMNTFKDFHASPDPAEDDKIMHSVLDAPGIKFMAADTPNSMEYKPGTTFHLALSGEDEDTLREYFGRLSDAGTVVMPLNQAPWGDVFGNVIDRFGVSWLVNITPVGA